MPRTTSLFARRPLPRSRGASILALACIAAAPAAFADSGLSQGGFVLVAGPENPPPDATATQTWRIDISNHNSVCDEKVVVTQKGDLINDHHNRDLVESLRSGSAKFGGFKLSRNGTPTAISEDLVEDSCNGDCDHPPLSVFFDITTGENAAGCDFKGYEQTVTIADRGKYCFTCCDVCDSKDEPEPPTPFNPTLTVDAATANTPGTGTLYGWVSRQVANQIVGQVAKVSAKKLGTCVVGAVDNADTFDQHQDSFDGPVQAPSERGCYVFHDVPLGDYLVHATGDGAPLNQINLSVTSDTPVEVNICDGSSCPSNPECAP